LPGIPAAVSLAVRPSTITTSRGIEDEAISPDHGGHRSDVPRLSLGRRTAHTAPPEGVGLSPGKLTELTSALQKLVDDGKIAGGAARIARHGKVAYTTVFGYRDLGSKTPMTDYTIFRITSMTKPVTCVAVMQLIEQGMLALDDPVANYLPELKQTKVLGDPKDDTGEALAVVPSTRPITVRHLLAHTAGFAYATRSPNKRLKKSYSPVSALEEEPGVWKESVTITDLVTALGKVALAHRPGDARTYGLSHDVLGRLVEVVSGKQFDQYLSENILQPLDMVDTSFLVPATQQDRVATIYLANPLGKLAPLPRNSGSATFFSGGGGLYSTLRDYTRFAEMLRAGGALEGRRIIRPETLQAMVNNQIGSLTTIIPGIPSVSGLKYGLGFGVEGRPASNEDAPVLRRYFWGGAFSTNFWVDPQHDVVALVLTQVLPFNHGDPAGTFRHGVDSAIEK
jgi:CubicO group peptidase (beta-lactamase class C family)